MIVPASDYDEFFRNFRLLIDAGLAPVAIGGNDIMVDDDRADEVRAALADSEPDDDERPPRIARKAEWETYAETLGIDTTDLTKNDIIDAVDQQEA